eukprot:366315_1
MFRFNLLLLLLPMYGADRINVTTRPHICNAQNDCSGHELVCLYNYCQINCLTANSCFNATMSAKMTYLEVHCSGQNSCAHSDIYDAAFVVGSAPNAMESATIHCNELLSWCSVSCSDTNSCLNAVIQATESAEVNIYCTEFEACHNMDIHCPPSEIGNFKCAIHGDSDQLYDVHTDFNIYAPNGWADIFFDDYNGLVLGGSMFCGGNSSSDWFVGDASDGYQCQIEYGLWDCMDPLTSPCTQQYVFIGNRQYFIVDDEYDANDTIVCDPYDGYTTESHPSWIWSACNLICRENGSCAAIEFVCAAYQKKECNVICSGAYSCNGLILNNMTNTGLSKNSIHVLCGGDGACQDAYLQGHDAYLGGAYSSAFKVNLFGTNTMIGTTINCVHGPLCDIRCQRHSSCKSGTVIGYNPHFYFVDIIIQCNGDYDSCSDMQVQCARYGRCIIRGLSVDQNEDFHIYSWQSWQTVDVSQWFNKTVIGNSSQMHCGSKYENTCIIDNNWNCSCLVEPTSSPTTSSPTAAPITKQPTISMAPTAEPITKQPTMAPTTKQLTMAPTASHEEETNDWMVVAIVFIVLFVIVLLIALYFGYKCNDRKIKQSPHTAKYGKVGASEVETADLNT